MSLAWHQGAGARHLAALAKPPEAVRGDLGRAPLPLRRPGRRHHAVEHDSSLLEDGLELQRSGSKRPSAGGAYPGVASAGAPLKPRSSAHSTCLVRIREESAPPCTSVRPTARRRPREVARTRGLFVAPRSDRHLPRKEFLGLFHPPDDHVLRDLEDTGCSKRGPTGPRLRRVRTILVDRLQKR